MLPTGRASELCLFPPRWQGPCLPPYLLATMLQFVRIQTLRS